MTMSEDGICWARLVSLRVHPRDTDVRTTIYFYTASIHRVKRVSSRESIFVVYKVMHGMKNIT
jgi:hypothetical protein